MKLTKSLLKIVLTKAYGNVSAVVKILKEHHGIEITRRAIDDRIKKNLDVKEAMELACCDIRDMAEHGLAKDISRGQRWAIKYMLDRAERRDERIAERTGGLTEDIEIIVGGPDPEYEKWRKMKSEAGCDNLRK